MDARANHQISDPEFLRRAVRKLNDRAAECEAFDPTLHPYYSVEAEPLRDRIRDCIRQVFGAESVEFDRHKVLNLYTAGSGNKSDADLQAEYATGIKRAAATLRSFEKVLREQLQYVDLTSTNAQVGIGLGDTETAGAGLYSSRHGHINRNRIPFELEALKAQVLSVYSQFSAKHTLPTHAVPKRCL